MPSATSCQGSRRVPPSWFLATSTVFSATNLRVCCTPLPVLGFAAFPAAPLPGCLPKQVRGRGRRFPATPFTPLEGFPSSTAVLRHRSRCPPAVAARPSRGGRGLTAPLQRLTASRGSQRAGPRIRRAGSERPERGRLPKESRRRGFGDRDRDPGFPSRTTVPTRGSTRRSSPSSLRARRAGPVEGSPRHPEGRAEPPDPGPEAAASELAKANRAEPSRRGRRGEPWR